MSTAAARIAAGYIGRKWAVIPVPPKSKRPVGEEWQHWRIGIDEVDLSFNDSQNIGVLLGAPSDGLVDVDLDCDEAVLLARTFLPWTAARFGRTSRRASHWLYSCTNPPHSTRRLRHAINGEGATLVELRSTGAQTIFPGSVHPAGEPIDWDEQGAPAAADADDLFAATRRLAAASLLAKFWPQGARHDAALALAGGLLRSEWPLASVLEFVVAVARAAGDDEIERDRVQAVRDTADKLARGEPATGWTTLAEIVDERVVKRALTWLGNAPPRPAADAPSGVPVHEVHREKVHRERANSAAVPLAELLERIEWYLLRYVHFAVPAQAVVAALWALHTHCFDQFEQSPILLVSSAVLRSGKSRLLDALEQVVARPWRAVRPSEAVVFREIEASAPTFMLDEFDTIFSDKSANLYEGLRAMLNAGNRVGTTVPRVVGMGTKMEVRRFSIFCPKVLAGIGNAPSTVADRSIPIRLKRRARGEHVERFRLHDASAEAAPLREQLAALRLDVGGARPQIPDELDDRAADSWEPLLAIADAAGGTWPVRARAAAHTLATLEQPDEEALGIRLLADVRAIFTEQACDRIATATLIGHLAVIEQSSWGDFDHGRAIGAHRLAALLRPFGVLPRTVRIGEKTPKGYLLESFADAFGRYLDPLSPFETATPAQGP